MIKRLDSNETWYSGFFEATDDYESELEIKNFQMSGRIEWNSVHKGFWSRWQRFMITNLEIQKDQFQNGRPKYKKLFVLDKIWYLRVFEVADYDL